MAAPSYREDFGILQVYVASFYENNEWIKIFSHHLIFLNFL